MAVPETPLGIKMRALAATGHARAAELLEKADAFDNATAKMNDPGDDTKAVARSILGSWARARRLWCECTGESLI